MMRVGHRTQRGFTLTELAIVVAIVAFLIGGTLMTLSAQTAAREVSETQRTLETAREALIGFMIRNGRLPCPAINGATGDEAPAGGGTCTLPVGWVPAATLGIGPTDAQGYLLDAWGDRIRYAVSQLDFAGPPAVTKIYTTAGGLITVGLTNPALPAPNLRVCITVPDTTPNTVCPSNPQFATPAVLYSRGRNGRTAGPVGIHEQENADGDVVFVAHEPRPAGAPGGEYDDLVIWISPNVLYNRLISAGAI
jgi:prepilin-type N-terminal cleavage/methylation domain-containing protein